MLAKDVPADKLVERLGMPVLKDAIPSVEETRRMSTEQIDIAAASFRAVLTRHRFELSHEAVEQKLYVNGLNQQLWEAFRDHVIGKV